MSLTQSQLLSVVWSEGIEVCPKVNRSCRFFSERLHICVLHPTCQMEQEEECTKEGSAKEGGADIWIKNL